MGHGALDGTEDSVKAALRRLAWRAAPQLMADRTARYQRALNRRWGVEDLGKRFIESHGDRVLAGPFRGMRYTATGDVAVAKLLGVYESEIIPWIVDALASSPAVFVDLGAADGYFAVGVAFASPRTKVHAFELSRVARAELSELAALNAVDLEVHRGASSSALARMPLADAVILCDIEGAELDVFTSVLIRHLTSTTVIVETHEAHRPGLVDELLRRFAATHTAERVGMAPRDAQRHPEIAALPEDSRHAALDEHRSSPTEWLRFRPNSQPGPCV